MQTIEAIYRIVTPMFIGGADKAPTDGIRPPSFKGALRFWWRTLNWGRYYQEAKGDEAAALKSLYTKECDLFGSAAKDGKGGQGIFLLRIEQSSDLSEDNLWPQVKPLGESGYLGLGLWKSGSRQKNNFQPHRISIHSNQPFKVELCFKPKTKDEDIKSIVFAIQALGLLGGLGSRSRRGFGSIALDTLDGKPFTYPDIQSYQKSIQTLFRDIEACDVMPPLTAWSSHARVGILISSQNNAQDAHKQAAKLFYQVRGMKAEVRGTNKRGFGQPLPLKPMRQEYNKRRASPLFFHIHPVANEFICSHIFMPAQFLPDEGSNMKFYRGVEQYMDKLTEVHI